MVSPAKREHIDREAVLHLGKIYRKLQSGALPEDDIFNSDETHFIIHLHSKHP